MELILEVTSDERHLMGEAARKSFRAVGGVIGRDPGCDWFIPDQKRHLSGRHAVVSLENDGFHLTDISTNGVFLNGNDEPVGRERSVRLNDADRLSMGNIEFIVRLQLDPDAVPYKSQSDKAAVGANPMRPAPGGQRKQQLDPLAVFRANHGLDANPAGQSPVKESSTTRFSLSEQSVSAPDHRPAAHKAFKAPNMLPEDWLGEPVNAQPAQSVQASPGSSPVPSTPLSTPLSIPQRPERAMPGVSQAAPARTMPVDNRSDRLLRCFFKGLGVSPGILEKVDGEKAMEEMGAVLKANMNGMVELMQQRAQLKNEFRMDMTLVKTQGNNPLKFSADSKQAMKHLFKPESGSFLTVSEAFTECYQDMQVHQLAVLAGVQSAMREMFASLSPQRVEEKLSKDKSGLSVSSKASRCWQKYQNLHAELVAEDDDFNRIFGDAFVDAYDEKVLSLKALMGGEESE